MAACTKTDFMTLCMSVVVRYKNRMTVAVSVAVGSAAQIGTFVVPLLVVISTLTASSQANTLSLTFPTFSVVTLALAVILAASLMQMEHSHWLGGVFLIALYFIIAVCLWVATDAV